MVHTEDVLRVNDITRGLVRIARQGYPHDHVAWTWLTVQAGARASRVREKDVLVNDAVPFAVVGNGVELILTKMSEH